MKFNQISDEFPIENKDNFLWSIIGAILLTITLVLLQQKIQFSKIALIPIVLIGIFLLRRMRRLFPDWTIGKDKIGEIEFREQSLGLSKNGNEIKYTEIRSIYFRYNFIKGRNYAPRDITHNGLAELKVTTKKGDTKIFKFVIETKEQLEHLKSIFKKWYKHGVEIKEEFTNHKFKTVCLEVIGNKSYKEIQQLKDELKKEASR